MKIPIEWLKQYVNTNKSDKEIAESFTSLGLMLDSPIENDILDLEHRMDRSDWLSILGCARDYAAFENIDLLYPELYKGEIKPAIEESKVKIEIKCPEIVKRFNTRVFKGVTVQESPDWLKDRLEKYGIPSINNIVDITNYVMVELGQPMHSQDIDKMTTPEIVIRKAKEGEKVETLLGETVELVPEAFVLTQGDKPTVIGGIVGGKSTGVTKDTTNIVLDAGNYDQTVVRKVSRKLKIQNETVLRYDKFLHPKLTEIALDRATKLILDIAGGTCYENEDWYPKKWPETEMKLRYERIHKVGGIEFTPSQTKQIVANLEYEILKENEQELILKVPYFRTDVVVEDDIVSDILRIYGYSNIPDAPLEKFPPREITPEIYKFEQTLREICVKNGLHEHITESLVQKNDSDSNQVKLENALSSEQNALRTDLYQTLFPVTNIYEKHGINPIKLFEIGLEYKLKGSKENYEAYKEYRKLEIIYSNIQQNPVQNLYEIKVVLSSILKELGITDYQLIKSDNRDKKETNIMAKDVQIGVLHSDSANIDTEALMEISKQRYRARIESDIDMIRTGDISIVIKDTQTLGEIISCIKKTNPDSVKDIWVVEQYKDQKFGKDKKIVLLRVEYKNGSFDELKKEVIQNLEDEFEIEIRSA